MPALIQRMTGSERWPPAAHRRPRGAQKVEGLFVARVGLFDGNAEAVELVLPVAAPDAEIEAPVGQQVDGGGVARQQSRVPEVEVADLHAETEPVADARRGRQRRVLLFVVLRPQGGNCGGVSSDDPLGGAGPGRRGGGLGRPRPPRGRFVPKGAAGSRGVGGDC